MKKTKQTYSRKRIEDEFTPLKISRGLLRRIMPDPVAFGLDLIARIVFDRDAAVIRFIPADATIEKWEKDTSRPSALYWKRIVEFVGFDPKTTNPTGKS